MQLNFGKKVTEPGIIDTLCKQKLVQIPQFFSMSKIFFEFTSGKKFGKMLLFSVAKIRVIKESH